MHAKFIFQFTVSVKHNTIALRSFEILSLNRVTVKRSMRMVKQNVLKLEFLTKLTIPKV